MTSPTLVQKFEGCLLGAMVGDVLGAAVEGETAQYIRKTFHSLDEMASLEQVDEPLGGTWKMGRYTDDTQMAIAVTEWLVEGSGTDGQDLVRRFSEAYEPWRRYGPGTRYILDLYKAYPEQWSALSTAMFPSGSYGNGSAMRAAPVGLRFHQDFPALLQASRVSSQGTHSHPLAYQGAALQATGVALAARGDGVVDPVRFLKALGATLSHFEERGQDTTRFREKMKRIEEALLAPEEIRPGLVNSLGNGIEVFESVPLALYSFLSNLASFEKALETAIFQGGDTDTIASMTGALSGAFLGVQAIPDRWIQKIEEKEYPPAKIRELGRKLAAILH